MKNLAEKYPSLWVVLSIVPFGFFFHLIARNLGVDAKTILMVQLPLFLVQLFSFFMIVRYRKIIF